MYAALLRFRSAAWLCVRGFGFHPRAVAASSARRFPPGDLAPSWRIRPERPLRPTGTPSRAGQIVPGFALDAPVGEDMAQAQVVGQIKQRRLMSQAGPRALVPPTSYGEGVGSETAGDLRPRQAGLHLEPVQALWEVVGENVGPSAVVCALSRHGLRLPGGTTGCPLRWCMATPQGSVPRRHLSGLPTVPPQSVGEPVQGEAGGLPLRVHVCGLFCCPGRCPMPVCAIDAVEQSGPLTGLWCS